MRRKPGALIPLEEAILHAAIRLWRTGSAEFHGYEIAKHVAEQSDRRSLTAYGTVYRALMRMEAMALLESRWEDPQIAATENRPGRRLYVLTGKGVDAAHATTRRPRSVLLPLGSAQSRRRRDQPKAKQAQRRRFRNRRR